MKSFRLAIATSLIVIITFLAALICGLGLNTALSELNKPQEAVHSKPLMHNNVEAVDNVPQHHKHHDTLKDIIPSAKVIPPPVSEQEPPAPPVPREPIPVPLPPIPPPDRLREDAFRELWHAYRTIYEAYYLMNYAKSLNTSIIENAKQLYAEAIKYYREAVDMRSQSRYMESWVYAHIAHEIAERVKKLIAYAMTTGIVVPSLPPPPPNP